MASICTIDSRLLPLLASAPPRSFRVTVFMAVNCIELKSPKKASCAIVTPSGSWPEMSAKLAMAVPTSRVLATSMRR